MDQALLIEPVVTDNSGNCNGAITLQITGGAQPYFVSWSNGMLGLQINQLCSGTYTATISDGNGCQKNKTATVGGATAVNTQDGEIKLQLYPNPVTGVLNADNRDNSPCLYRIYNLMGLEMQAAELKPGLNSLDLGGYPAGNYVFRAVGVYGNRVKIISKL